jgi:hypothetical protein
MEAQAAAVPPSVPVAAQPTMNGDAYKVATPLQLRGDHVNARIFESKERFALQLARLI